MATPAITPRRRSARLQAGNNNTPGRSRTATPSRNPLDSVMEGVETSEVADQSLDAVVTATPSTSSIMPGTFNQTVEAPKTPESVKQLKPSHEEMHPEHAHQSTFRVSNAGLKLGFTDVNPYQSSPLRPNNYDSGFSPAPVSHVKSSPGYEFNFKHDRPDLSEEARRIMESVREEAARIKEQMRRERDEQARRDGVDAITGRRIAKPKSRFSDAHQAEFNKMQSITDHVAKSKSGSRNNSPIKERIMTEAKDTPTKERSILRTPIKATLKRTRSKADMDTPTGSKTEPRLGIKRTQSTTSLQNSSPIKPSSAANTTPSRTENPEPAKRRRMFGASDVSDARAKASNIPSPKKTGLPAAASTPTRSSLIRAQKTPDGKKSMFGLQRSRSLKDIAKAGGSLRAASDKIASVITSKVTTVKSILHKPQPKYSDDPLKIAAGTHIPHPKETPSTNRGTPSLPGTPQPNHTLPRPTPKRVEFAPDTKGPVEHVASPSPMKAAKPSIRLLPPAEDQVETPVPTTLSSSPSRSPTITYPTLPKPPSKPAPSAVANNSPLPRPNPLFSNPPTAQDFTFSHEKRIVFAELNSAKRTTPTPTVSSSNNTTPNSARPAISGRPSLVPKSAAAVVGASPSRLHAGRTPARLPTHNSLPAVPHGMTNKKRAREPEEDEGSGLGDSDAENRDPNVNGAVVESKAQESSPRKRAKMAAGIDVSSLSSLSSLGAPKSGGGGGLLGARSRSVSPMKSPVRPMVTTPKSHSSVKKPRRQTGFGHAGSPSLLLSTPTQKKGLSLSRLNFLSRPKERS